MDLADGVAGDRGQFAFAGDQRVNHQQRVHQDE